MGSYCLRPVLMDLRHTREGVEQFPPSTPHAMASAFSRPGLSDRRRAQGGAGQLPCFPRIRMMMMLHVMGSASLRPGLLHLRHTRVGVEQLPHLPGTTTPLYAMASAFLRSGQLRLRHSPEGVEQLPH